jgi:hypothetical protein
MGLERRSALMVPVLSMTCGVNGVACGVVVAFVTACEDANQSNGVRDIVAQHKHAIIRSAIVSATGGSSSSDVRQSLLMCE